MELKTGWPSLLVQGGGGPALKIVTVLGVVEMRRTFESSSYDTFQAELGNGRELVIRFSEVLLQ